MRISKANKEKFKEVYLSCCHSYFDGYSYDYDNRQIKITCPTGERNINLVFNNVIYSEMQSCSFWNGGDLFYHIGIEEDDFLLKRLYEYRKDYNENADLRLLERAADFLPIYLIMNSGDTLYILCESIDWTE